MNPNKDCYHFLTSFKHVSRFSKNRAHITKTAYVQQTIIYSTYKLWNLVKSAPVFSSFWAEEGVPVQEGDGDTSKSYPESPELELLLCVGEK